MSPPQSSRSDYLIISRCPNKNRLLAFQSRTPFPVAPSLITRRSWHCYNSKLSTALFFGDDIVIKSDNPEWRIYMNQSAHTARLRLETKLPSLPEVPEG
jgi:hypothetical protein